MEYGSVMERRGVMKSFIQQVEREESHVTVHYVLPLPPEKVPDLQPGVLDTVLVGGPAGIRTLDTRIKSPML